MRGNWASGFPNRFDTNRPVQSQKMSRSLKSGIQEEALLYYLCCENKGPDQLRSNCEADLHQFSQRQKSDFLMTGLMSKLSQLALKTN